MVQPTIGGCGVRGGWGLFPEQQQVTVICFAYNTELGYSTVWIDAITLCATTPGVQHELSHAFRGVVYYLFTTAPRPAPSCSTGATTNCR